MDEKKKWTVKDAITTVLLSAVLIVIQLVVNMVCMANDFVSMVLSVGDWTTFFTRPISCVFIIIAFLSLIYPFVLAHLKQRKAAKKGEQA